MGLAEGWGMDCVGVPLAPGFGLFALAGVPPPPPYLILGPGGTSACHLPLSLVRGPPLLALHTSLQKNPKETRLLGR